MGDETTIGWTDHTMNPWWGCVKVSPACDHCYAERDSHRYGFADGGSNGPELWGKNAERRHLSDRVWNRPLIWEKEAIADGRPHLVFCASMADVFEARDDLDADRARLWRLIEDTPHLIWQLLTKRPEQVLRRVPRHWLRWPECEGAGCGWRHDPNLPCFTDETDHDTPGWPPNVWVGTTVEDQHYADLRVPRLLEIPAPVLFLSCEPLLGPVDLDGFLPEGYSNPTDYGTGIEYDRTSGIDWIIVGGESGPGFRPMDFEHARSIVRQADAAGVPVFYKQQSAPLSGKAGPPDLDVYKAFPPEAGERGTLVEVG